MAGKNYEIKTTLAIDGEKKFKQALEDAGRSMRVMDSEMKKAEAAYKAGGDGAEYFASKSGILKNEVKQQEAVVQALQQAVKDAATKYGEASKNVDNYKIKLNQAETNLIKLKKASQDADKEAEELGRDAKKVGQQISDGIGEGAEDANKKAKSAFDGIAETMEQLRDNAVFQTAWEVGGFVVDTIGNAMGFVQEQAQTSMQLAIAQYNLERYGYSWDQVDDLVVRAAAITGDHEGAIAAVTSLVQYGFSDIGMLEAAMDAILGGIIFRPGMSLETLAEDILATINTREASGAYAELVTEVLGLATSEEINAAMEAANSQEEAAHIALNYLTRGGLQTATQEIVAQNQDLMRYNQEAQELASAWNDFSQLVMPAVTGIIDLMSDVIRAVTEWLENQEFIQTLAQYNQTGMDPGNALYRAVLESAQQANPNYAAAADEALRNGNTVWGAELRASGAALWDRVRNRAGDYMYYGTGAWLADVFRGELGFGEGLWQYITRIGGQNNITDLFRNEGEAAEQRQNFWDWILPSAGAEEMPVGWEEYAANARTQMENELANGEGAHNAGVEMINQFGQGIEEGTAAPIAAVQNMVNQINSLLGGVGSGAYGLGFAGMGGVSLVVDGQELGRAVAGGVSSTLGRRVATRMYAD